MSDRPEEPVNPLAQWLGERRHIRHIDFAQMVRRTEGTVTRWCAGTRHPRPTDQARIAVATGNAVRPEDWHAYYVALHPLEDEAA